MLRYGKFRYRKRKKQTYFSQQTTYMVKQINRAIVNQKCTNILLPRDFAKCWIGYEDLSLWNSAVNFLEQSHRWRSSDVSNVLLPGLGVHLFDSQLLRHRVCLMSDNAKGIIAPNVTGQLADCQLADWTSRGLVNSRMTRVIVVVLSRSLCGHKTRHCVILKCFIIKCNLISLSSHLLMSLREYWNIYYANDSARYFIST